MKVKKSVKKKNNKMGYRENKPPTRVVAKDALKKVVGKKSEKGGSCK